MSCYRLDAQKWGPCSNTLDSLLEKLTLEYVDDEDLSIRLLALFKVVSLIFLDS